ncbi:Chloroperoxidase [Hygrophoropsis aurantiaca]|uniref:Chloroperoxidase n=1 Tax=Hygrophoropsis aurantiaca TaxID=72124 RepID=A0ACB8AFK3_9AGAM|nr:Chloroperoxidase [Hygrophoropsis aurantiaca]
MLTFSRSFTEHRFEPATPSDRRSPCPALNALANHGYLPRDGKDIGLWQLIQALHAVYNLSYPLAALLAIAGILFCGHALCLDLDALAMHNRIEHDASMVHANTLPGHSNAPTLVDPKLLHSFLAEADVHKGLGLEDLARVRIFRESRLSRPLDVVHSEVGMGEAGLCWLLLKGKNGRIPISTLSQWFGEERIPAGWLRPREEIGLLEARETANEVAAIMKHIKKW